MWTQEITETRNGRTSVHRVGLLAGLSAVVLWGAVVAFIITVVAMATPSWIDGGYITVGLWKMCRGSSCMGYTSVPGMLKVSTFTPHSRRSKTSQYTEMSIETNVLEQTTALHERQHGKCNVRTDKDYSITSLSSTHD